jgi:branched-chain amino acid transport system substrate-binding protein
MTRRLVEQDEVLAVFPAPGNADQHAVRKYLNERKVPAIVHRVGRDQVGRFRKISPGPSAGNPTINGAQIYAKYLLATKPNAKVGILYQNDDSGKDYVKDSGKVLETRPQHDRARKIHMRSAIPPSIRRLSR